MTTTMRADVPTDGVTSNESESQHFSPYRADGKLVSAEQGKRKE